MTIVLLPPSESKITATGHTKLNLNNLAFPELVGTREQVLAGLIALSQGPSKKARSALGISQKQDWEIERNQQLLGAPVAPAWQIYSGVLYDALDPNWLTSAQLKKINQITYVQSALFGLVSLDDQIPAYRLSGDCVLPKLGSLAKVWAQRCTSVLADHDDFIVDLRSGIYVKLGPIPAKANAVVPKIMQRMSSGPPKVISHHNKATKGRILRAVAMSKIRVTSIESLANVITTLGADVNIKKPAKNGNPTIMEVIVAEH